MHLVVAVSAHGFGHGAQTAPVLAELRRRLPDLRVTVLSGLPPAFLRARIPGDFTMVPWHGDFGLRMVSALDVDLIASRVAYADFHRDWPARVDETARMLEQLVPDLLLANIPYLPLTAAASLGVPTVALCSLNWACIYRHYFGAYPEAPAILGEMVAAYDSARMFVRPEPALPMPELTNCRTVRPVARVGAARPAALRKRLGVGSSHRLVAVSPGGIEWRPPIETWPDEPDLTWIVPAAWAAVRRDVIAFESLGLDFVDLVASVDGVVGKLGYGTVTECACNGTGMLYVPRPDWPEDAVLARWMARHGRLVAISRPELESGRLRGALERLWAMPTPPRPEPGGSAEAADVLMNLLAPPMLR